MGRSTRVLVQFCDYECPFCRAESWVFKDLVASNPAVGVVIRHLPLTSIHPRSADAAAASVCAEAQGRFSQMHERLFTSAEWQIDGDWAREAEAAGVPDVGGFLECLTKPTTSERLEEDRLLAADLGVLGTPSLLFPDGTVQVGVLEADKILANIR